MPSPERSPGIGSLAGWRGLFEACRSRAHEVRKGLAEEIAQELDAPVEKVQVAMRCAREPKSLDAPLGEEGDATLGDLLEDARAPSPLQNAIHSALSGETERLLETLSPRSRR